MTCSDAPLLRWQPGFAQLGPAFFTALRPTPVPSPYWVCTNPALAQTLGLPDDWTSQDHALQAMAGNTVLPGSEPLASVYSGHQFGMWAGQLGDGRAILLGETTAGLEVQLKGSGRTPYSRMGDGRAVLRSSIREFLCSEAMHGLGIPTTRALSIVGSDLPVQRETTETAAVVARVAPSFVRFGHFEHFAARNQAQALRALADYVIDRFYPDCRKHDAQPPHAYAALLQAVTERTAALLAQWQAVGFCHGVMNTDNMSILGLTLDYGPFQFMDRFVPGHICNHSDTQGRYAFQRQPSVAYWNLFCLAQALMPLMEDEDLARNALASFQPTYAQQFMRHMRAKLGLLQTREGDEALVDGLLTLLAQEGVDYPIFWRRLSHAVARNDFGPVRDLFMVPAHWDAWLLSYLEQQNEYSRTETAIFMLKTNPKYVLRNHLAEQAIRAAQEGDYTGVQTLLQLLSAPFDEHPAFDTYADFPPDWAQHISISCSS